MRTIRGITALTLVAAFAAACTGGAASPSPAATDGPHHGPHRGAVRGPHRGPERGCRHAGPLRA